MGTDSRIGWPRRRQGLRNSPAEVEWRDLLDRRSLGQVLPLGGMVGCHARVVRAQHGGWDGRFGSATMVPESDCVP